MAKAELDTLPLEVADQARFIIQAQALIDPEKPGQHFPACSKMHLPFDGCLGIPCTLRVYATVRRCSLFAF